jgi:hypothetical protein
VVLDSSKNGRNRVFYFLEHPFSRTEKENNAKELRQDDIPAKKHIKRTTLEMKAGRPKCMDIENNQQWCKQVHYQISKQKADVV